MRQKFPIQIAVPRRVGRHRLALALALLGLPGYAQHPALIAASWLPDAPAPQFGQQPENAQADPTVPLATLGGFVTDSDGAAVAGAHVLLAPESRQHESTSTGQETVSAADGGFTFSTLTSGFYTLSITATGFAPQHAVAELHPGEIREIPGIALTPSSSSSVEVMATQTEIAEAQINQQEKQRVLGAIPNFYVSYIPNPVPLNPRQKFQLAVRTLIDPVSFVLNGVSAGIQQAGDVYDWGEGAQGYGKRYAAAYGTFLTGTLIGSAALPILFKQDPRYFYKGVGTVRFRAGYAIANAVICKGDNHRWQVNYSAILGGLAASGLANAYYPAPNRSSPALTFEGAAIGTGISAISNLLQEFLIQKLTPHIPRPAPANP